MIAMQNDKHRLRAAFRRDVAHAINVTIQNIKNVTFLEGFLAQFDV